MEIAEIRLHINPCKTHSIYTANYSNNSNVITTDISTIINTFKVIFWTILYNRSAKVN